MTNMESLARRFVAIWNEPDPGARRAEVEALWAVDGRHLMGASDVTGHEALAARVAASHDRSVLQGGNVFTPPTAIQTLPGAVKFRWEMARRDGGEVRSGGIGILLVDEQGRIARDYLFTES